MKRLLPIASGLRQIVMGPAEEEASQENSAPSVEELARELIKKVLQTIQSTQESLPQTGKAAATALDQFQESTDEHEEKKLVHRTFWQRVVGMPIVKRRLRRQIANEVTEILKSRAHFITSQTCSVAKTGQQIATIIMRLHEENQLSPETLAQDARGLLEQFNLPTVTETMASIARKIEMSLKKPEEKVAVFLNTLKATKQKIESGSTWGLTGVTDLPTEEVKEQTNLICSISNEVALNPVKLTYGSHVYDINTLIQYVESCTETRDNPFPLVFVWPNSEIDESGSLYCPNESWDKVITAEDDEELARSLESMQILLKPYYPEIKTWKEHIGTYEIEKQLDSFIQEQDSIKNWDKKCPISGKLIRKPMRVVNTTEPVFCANSLKELARRIEQSADGTLSINIGDSRLEIHVNSDSNIINLIHSVEYDVSAALRLQRNYTRDHQIWLDEHPELIGSESLSRIEELRGYILEGVSLNVLNNEEYRYLYSELEEAGASSDDIAELRSQRTRYFSGP